MAYYAALVSLVQLLEDIIHRDRYPNIFFDKQDIASAHEKFSFLQTLLDDYATKNREAFDSLERRIRDASYEAQDIIESHISDIIESHISNKTHLWFKLGSERSQQLEQVGEEVDSIVEELMSIKESDTIEDNLQLNYYSAAGATSNQASVANTTMGFEERLATIMGELCGERSKLQVISIVGMGGIGKTTIARNIFEDKFMNFHFDCNFWVTISQDYHLQKVLLDILDCMDVTIDKSSQVVELGTAIYKFLQGRKYLIIMDDMWDTKVWDFMKSILPDDSNGSRIMITTRISNVALYVDRFGFYYRMEFLNEEQSWNLFREKVFCPPELEDVGRLIAKNCRGLPLAIVVIAGLLDKVNKTQYDWEEIASNVCSIAAENDEHFLKILSLSYNHLPHHLKPCLLYIGGFPEDYEIPVCKLVKLWVAEGFVKPAESKSLEAMAEEYLEDLVNRNLVLITRKRTNGKIKCCGLHDLFRDLCKERISYENFIHVMHRDCSFHPTPRGNVRHLHIPDYYYYYSSNRPEFTGVEKLGSHVRSIICGAHYRGFLFFKSGFKLLRVHDSCETAVSRSFPPEILELFHLKYLAIALRLPDIPPSIFKLQNLQTLIIILDSFLEGLCSLPPQIRKMPNLRHIMSSRNLYLSCEFLNESFVHGYLDKRSFLGTSILENLHTLSRVNNVMFTNEVIEMIPNLQKLKVLCYEKKAIEWQKFRLDSLFHFRQLETLNIEFCDSRLLKVNPLPEGFVFPLMLKKLSLRHCRLPWKDMMVVGSLPNLQVLKLREGAFVGEKWVPVEGDQFPQLKFLLMERLELKYWQVENTYFPTLKHLKISYCHNLQEIPPEIGDISTLELIEVGYSKLIAKSALKMQEEQQDMGNDLQVHVHPQYKNFREEEALESEEEVKIQKEASESKEEIQEEEGLKRKEEIQEEASESKKEAREEKGPESQEQIQGINPVNDLSGRAHKPSKFKCFCFH